MSGTTGKALRAALYARVSTTGHGQDVGLQLEELRAAAAQRGWVVVEEFVDDGVSGAKASRPALDLDALSFSAHQGRGAH
jgi:DNA invertase Pin-like site-specific DNA recombinase